MRITLGKKLFLYTSCSLVGVLLLTFLMLERVQSRQWEEHLTAQSLAFARIATPEILKLFRGVFPPRGQEQAAEVLDFLGLHRELVRFTLYSSGGRVLYRSPPFPEYLDLDLEAVPSGPPGRMNAVEPTVRTHVLPGGGRVLDLTAPAFGPTGEHLLTVRYLISYDTVDARLAEVRQQFLGLGVAAVLASLLLVALVARRITLPIAELTEGARAVSRGELETRIGSVGQDEIGALAGAFNDMAASLSRSRVELTEKNRELSLANEELRRIQEHLIRAERLAAIGQLAAGVSHEIDNPVGIILGHAELLLEDLPEEDPRREDVQAIIDECKRCRRITGGLLGFARTAPPRREPLDLGRLAEQTLASLRPQKLFRRVDGRIECRDPLPPITADADQLRQVLVNLLLNAAQAMNGEGRLQVILQREKDRAVVLVEDSGPGIPEAERERIFEPFYSTKERGEGTGLGLSVCRRLVENHGGRLMVAASPAGGARFRIELPLQGLEKNFDNGSGDSLP